MGFQDEQNQQRVPEQHPQDAALDFDNVVLPDRQPDMEGDGQEAARKRPREEDNGDPHPGEDTVVDMLVKGLSTVPATALTDLRKALSKLHTVKLDNARQIADMEERQRQGIPPRGFALPTFHMPAGTEAEETAAKDRITAVYVEVYSDMIAGRYSHIEQTAEKMNTLLADRTQAQMIIVDQMIAGNPTRYTGIQKTSIRELITVQIQKTLAAAEMEADRAAAKSAVVRAKAAEERKKNKAEADAAAAKDEGSVTLGDMKQLLEQHREASKKEIKDLEKQHAKKIKEMQRSKPSSKSTKATAQHKADSKQGRGKKGTNNGSKAKGNRRDNNPSTGTSAKRQRPNSQSYTAYKPKSQKPVDRKSPPILSKITVDKSPKHRTLTATESVTSTIVVNLTRAQLDPSVSELLSLGPVFRPTPKPSHDSIVQQAIRSFAKSTRTSAHFALNPPKEEREYEPKLYKSTGRAVDPDSPELDYTLMQYESTISKALAETSHMPVTDNLTKSQRLTLSKMSAEAKSGEGQTVYLTADKDTAFVAVTQQQHETMWYSHICTKTYSQVDYFQVDWDGYRRTAVRLATEAHNAELISTEEYRYVTKDCKGPIRTPVGNLKIKTHKPINLYAKSLNQLQLLEHSLTQSIM